MNDKEIRHLINAAAENPETDMTVSADEVKSLVMAKIGAEIKNSDQVYTESIKYTEPTFVTRKKNIKPYLAAAAACAGIVCAVGYFAIGSTVVDLSAGGVSESGSFAEEGGIDEVLTKKEEETSEAPLEEIRTDKSIVEIKLLDGYTITYDHSVSHTSHTTVNGQNTTDILELRNGRLWFIGNGENIDVAEAAGDKSYYIYSYYNEGSQSEHKLVIGNTAEPLECGYFEMYRGREDGRWHAQGKNCYVFDDVGQLLQSPIADGYKQWVYDAVREFDLTAFDKKTADRIAEGEVIDMETTIYITGSAMPIFADNDAVDADEEYPLTDDPVDERFRLLDGSTVRARLTSDENTLVHESGSDGKELFAAEDGRIYFIGSGEHIDITDSIGEDKAYVYTYTHPERNIKHYFIAGGSADSFGYAEVFPYPNTNFWEYNGINLYCNRFIDDNSSLICYQPWLYSALNELNIAPNGGSSGYKDFSYLFND